MNAQLTSLLDKGVALCFDGAREYLKTIRFVGYTMQRSLEASVLPAANSLLDIQQQVAEGAVKSLTGRRPAQQFLDELSDRALSAARFSHLVQTLGKGLFGSARFPGEEVLLESGPYRLSFIPPGDGAPAQDTALFHAAGALPYSDRIFRILPEANLFLPFLERGLPVYLMELAGDRSEVDYSGVTLEALIEHTSRLTAAAFEHSGKRKMVLEGYCGHAMQALAYVAARPEEADARFHTVATFVAPIDGRECALISDFVQATPGYLHESVLGFWNLFGGYLPGESIQIGLDIPLKTAFLKSTLGYMVTGWGKSEYSKVRKAEDLSPIQRRELAGAYWISPENIRRFPIPVDLVRFASALFGKGITPDGGIPQSCFGKPLSFQDIRDKTRLRILGFYGGKDAVVPDRTAHVLMTVFRDRYTHVVHPFAGHISYILSPEVWNPASPAALKPNPIDVILEKGMGLV